MGKSNSIAQSIVYKSLERYTTFAFQMIVQIVIARILAPSDYGVVAMMTVFINIASVFVNNGFNMAVVQKKEATEDDFSTAQIINLLIGVFLYSIIYLSAPSISEFYNEPALVACFRVLGLILPLSSVFSIQGAIASRHMQFKDLFYCNLSGSFASGIVGVAMALIGFGYWALIAQQMTRIIISTLLLLIRTKWHPHIVFVWNSAKEMFSFGWKLLVAGLINQAYNELNSLIIGRKYSSADLAFYTKGKYFPTSIGSGVDSALQSVLLSAFSKKQSDINSLHILMKKSVIINTYILTPLMMLLAVISEPLVRLVLTEKWLPAVPFMQICCFTYALHPITSINLQALTAVGRSDVRLKMEFIKKPLGILILLVAMNYGPIAIAWGAAINSLVGLIIGFIACQIYINYSSWKLIRDIGPTWILSLFVAALIYILKFSMINSNLIMVGQIIIGVVLYYLLSHIFQISGYKLFIDQISKFRKHEKNFNN